MCRGMGQGITKRVLAGRQPSIYKTSVWARRYRRDFEALQLSEEQVRLMWEAFCKIDEDKSGEISLWELFEALEMKQSKFTKRIFRIFDEDGSGSVDFREFVMSLWNYCTLSKAALIMFAFDLYDNDNSGEIDVMEVELLLREVYGREFQANAQAQAIMAKIRGGDLGMTRSISVDNFREFCRTHPAILYPAFVLQTQMQEKILGSKFWNACSESRVRLSSGEYISISALLHAHVSEKAFQDLVETTDAVTGKPAMPLANADNVAMLQVSGTLANRRELQTTVKSHMSAIKAMAKESKAPATNNGSSAPASPKKVTFQDVVVQAQNDSQTKNEAGSDVGNTNVVGEQKKAVSWGTVKTHKVYAVEDPDRSNGEKEPGNAYAPATAKPAGELDGGAAAPSSLGSNRGATKTSLATSPVKTTAASEQPVSGGARVISPAATGSARHSRTSKQPLMGGTKILSPSAAPVSARRRTSPNPSSGVTAKTQRQAVASLSLVDKAMLARRKVPGTAQALRGSQDGPGR